MHGYFENGRIYVDVEVYGVIEDLIKPFKARLDTGFDGYLSLPLVDSFSLALILKGTQSYTIADGSEKVNLVCFGNVKCGEKSVIVPIDISAKSPILIGAALLKEFGYEITIDYVKQSIKFAKTENSPTSIKQPLKSEQSKK